MPKSFRSRAVFLLLLAASAPVSAAAGETKGPVLAAFAHPDDERLVGPLLAKLSREGWDVHLVIATDGSKGVRDHAGIAAGSALAQARVKESECAARRLGIRQLHMVGLEDGSLGTSMPVLADLRSKLSNIVKRVRPQTIITFGPEGGTGHPDHRLVGNVTTEIVLGGDLHRSVNLLYASLPSERLRAAPASMPTVSGVSEDLLTVRVPVSGQDIEAARQSFACHATQYTPAEMAAINRTLTYVWNGINYLRPWNGSEHGVTSPFEGR
jgi:LmbE family N-acetylglucosaminyl deacetylase